MLRLVHPAPAGQATGAPKGRRFPSPALSLSREESRRLRIATKNTARAYGGMDVLATATGLSIDSLKAVAYGRGPGSVAVARLVARAGGVSLEAVLSGAINEAGRCEACAQRAGHGTARAVGGAS